MSHAAHIDASRAASPELAAFLSDLQRELTLGTIELPSFPDVSLQIQRLLSDDNVATDKVVRLVGAEPVLAARIMQLANSAALNPSGTPILELRTAVARLGFDSLRAAAVSFAMTQLRLANAYKSIEVPLEMLWSDNVLMASTACVVARRCHRISPDTALFAGLVSGVGKICLLARASQVPALARNPSAYHEIVSEWHAEVARALLTSWNVAEDIVSAVHTYEKHSQVPRGLTPLTDVLSVAELLSFHHDMPEQIVEALRNAKSAMRLGLSADACVTLLTETQAEVTSLRNTLGQ
jgi:HD-like signal output (HDOD) protein